MQNEHWLLPEGIDEILPPQAIALERLRRKLLDFYSAWGYELVFPPLIEYLESLLTGAGGDLDLQTFKLTDQITGRTLGIRADITPQAARIDAHQLRRDCPTRLCYLGTVLNTRSGGLDASRSPLQTGAELYGHGGVEADLEILCLMLDSLHLAGLEGVYLDLGHVGIFRGLARQADLQHGQEMALFDALQRKAIPEIEQLVREFGLDPQLGEMMGALAELCGEDALGQAEQRLSAATDAVQEAVADLRHLADQLALRRPEIPVHYDLSELRGYHYHTGTVFAAFVPSQGQEVARGGRYDDIGRLFGRARPACGFSLDLKLLLRLAADSTITEQASIFAPASQDPALQRAIRELRDSGRRVICGLPGQHGSARDMGCGEILVEQEGEWRLTGL